MSWEHVWLSASFYMCVMCNPCTLCVPCAFHICDCASPHRIPSLCVCVWLATAPTPPCRASTIFFICCSFVFLFFPPPSSSLFALGKTMSGLISFSNHRRLQGKSFWLGCLVPANTKERGERIITLVVDNSCSDHSAVICLWCSLWLQLMLSLLCHCPLHGATPLLQAVQCSSSLARPCEI